MSKKLLDLTPVGPGRTVDDATTSPEGDLVERLRDCSLCRTEFRTTNKKRRLCTKCGSAYSRDYKLRRASNGGPLGYPKHRAVLKVKHGHAREGRLTRTYTAWCSLKARCYTKSVRSYPQYGGRGIKVCERWKSSFGAFLEDMGVMPEGYRISVDRIDGDGDYEPGNCRWATPRERVCKKITHGGITLTQKEWNEKLGFRPHTIGNRLREGWSMERALTTPVFNRGQP